MQRTVCAPLSPPPADLRQPLPHTQQVSGGTTDGLVQAALALHTVGVDATPFLHVSVQDDPFDPTRALFALRNASLTLPRTAYGNDTATALAVSYMTTVLQLVYQDSPSHAPASNGPVWPARTEQETAHQCRTS